MVRALKKLSLREHAKALDVSPATLSRIERGYGCDLDVLVRIHKRTGVAYAVLLGELPLASEGPRSRPR
jgi:transcriptional regulator with XRE-family HTH domain